MALEKEIERRCRHGEPTSFVYADLDNFKAFNDAYGFEAGDKMIRLTGQVICAGP